MARQIEQISGANRAMMVSHGKARLSRQLISSSTQLQQLIFFQQSEPSFHVPEEGATTESSDQNDTAATQGNVDMLQRTAKFNNGLSYTHASSDLYKSSMVQSAGNDSNQKAPNKAVHHSEHI